MLKKVSGALFAVAIIMLPFGLAFSQDDGYSGEPIWVYGSDLNVRHVETADLNGDGTEDVIIGEYDNTNYGDPSKVIALDGETGDTIWTYQLQDGVRSMTIGDLNNDGVMDVIAGASYHSTNTPDGYVHAINGSNGTSLWTYYIGATIDGVTTANLNGDAFLDVAAGSFDDHVYGINGETGAELWSHDVASLWVNDVDAGDVNGDGIDDVGYAHEYLAGWDNYCGMLNGTNGTIIWEDTVDYAVLDVLISDIDSDGQLEAIYSGATASDSGKIFIRNAADGTIEWQYNLGSMNHTNGEIFLYEFDIDEDGDIDLVIGNHLCERRIFAFEGDVPVVLWASDSLNGYPSDLAFGDVIGDGNLNVIAATWDRVQVVDVNTGSKVWYYGVAGTISSVGCADFDGDGTADVAAGGTSTGENVWALKTVQSPLLWEFELGEYGNSIALGDLDGDGCDDVIAVCSVIDRAWAISGSTGVELWYWTGTENLYTVTTGDFNNDGQLDVAVAGNDDMVTALYGDNGTVMWQFTTPTDQIYRKCLKAADLNGDGNVDVIAGSDDHNVYAINGETGTEIWTQNVGGYVDEIELAQMNGTGPLDVVVAVSNFGEKVVVLDGVDGGVLWEYAAPEAVGHVEVFDVNNDGTLDVAAAVTPYNPKQIIMIDGATHTYMWSVPLPIASSVLGLGHGDLNGDGVPDLLVPGSSDDKKVYALSGDDGHELWNYPTNGEINCVLGYDVDGDGNCEAVAGSDDQKVYIINGQDGSLTWEFPTTGDVMHILVGDLNCNDLPNIACVTFDSDGRVYAFRSLSSGVVNPGFIAGVVKEDDDITPISDVLVSAFDSENELVGTDTTDLNGEFDFTLDPGTYYAMFSKTGYVDTTLTGINVVSDETTYVSLIMYPSGCDYVPGDANGDGNVMGNDVTYSVRYFKGIGTPPPDSCWNDDAGEWLYSGGDANGNCAYTGSDVTFLVAYFKGYNPEILYCEHTPPIGGGLSSLKAWNRLER